MGSGFSALSTRLRRSGKGGMASPAPQSQYTESQFTGGMASPAPQSQYTESQFTGGMASPAPQRQYTTPYAAPFQQRYVQQFNPAPTQFVHQSAEDYRSPFGRQGGKGIRGEKTYFYRPVETIPAAAPAPAPAPDPYSYYEYMPGGAAGGIIKAAAGRYLQGPGDGTSDSIPATIGNVQPARLADGEFVIDARTVSEIGNGSSNAGAKKLYAMMERVHKERKKAKRGQNTNADRFLPR